MGSIYEYITEELKSTLSKSFISIFADSSNSEDQLELELKETEPVTVTEEVVF